MRSLLAILFLSSLTGCTVRTLEDTSNDQTENTCETRDECGGGECINGICVAPTGELGTLLVQISAPSESGGYSLLSFLQTVENMSHVGGSLDLFVEQPGEIEAEVIPTPGGVNCTTAYGPSGSPTVPVRVRFRPSERVFGLAASEVDAESQLSELDETYRFKARMAPGKYDVYVEPTVEDVSGACSVVPQVFRNFEVSAGAIDQSEEPTPLYLQTPSVLKVTVQWPTTAANANKSLQDWNVDILDPTTGWVLSRSAKLALDLETSEPGLQTYVATVEYSQLPDEHLAGKELVRISPPSVEAGEPKPVAPTFVLERKAVELLTEGEARIDQIATLPDPIDVDGYLFDSDAADAKAISAALTLRFVSKKLAFEGSQAPSTGAPVYFSTEIEATDGKFQVRLLPGDYDVYAIPASSESNVAVTKSTLTVALGQNPQTGKSIVIDPTTQLQGLAVGPDGSEPIVGAKVRATASPVGLDPVWIALGLTPPKPLSSEDLVGKDGGFTVDVHPGALDVSIRPSDSTGFAWLVRPNVAVQAGIHDLGTMQLPLPVVYAGSLWVDGDTTLPNALIQAYVFLDAQGYTDDRASAKAVVQVAETRANELGEFQLLLPAHLN